MNTYIKTILKTNSDIHTRSTRFSNLNFLCRHALQVYKKNAEEGRTFSVRINNQGLNQLPLDIKKALLNVKNFKKNLIFNLIIEKQKETRNFE